MTPKKAFHVTLRDGRYVFIEAETYRREGDQYVFDGTASGDVEFVIADEVVAIAAVPPSPGVVGGAW